MELDDYLRVLRAHWVGVLLIILLAVAGAVAYNETQPKVYAANATGFVSTGTTDNPALGSASDSLAKSRATSYVDVAESRATAQQVIDKLGLSTTPQSLIGSISVVQPPDTVLLKITAKGATPKASQRLADAWIAALAEQVASIEDPRGKAAPGTLRVIPIESAALPSSPVSPRVMVNIFLGLILGMLLGLAYAVLRSLLDRRLRTLAEVERKFAINVMGSIPNSSELAHRRGELAVLATGEGIDNRSDLASSEAFRKLRTNLRFMDVDSPPRVIVVTSPQPNDGKSTIAANLAAAIGLSGQPVVLVDGDLRRPTVAESFGLVQGAGLTDVLAGQADVHDLLQRASGHPNLQVLASGSIPPNPSELMGSKSMRTLLHKLSESAIVIIDAPPLLPVTDAAVLTAITDGAFVVISAGKTLDTELAAALGHLQTVNGRALGIILNRISKRGPDTGYYQSNYYRADATKAADKQARTGRGKRRSQVKGAAATENVSRS